MAFCERCRLTIPDDKIGDPDRCLDHRCPLVLGHVPSPSVSVPCVIQPPPFPMEIS